MCFGLVERCVGPSNNRSAASSLAVGVASAKPYPPDVRLLSSAVRPRLAFPFGRAVSVRDRNKLQFVWPWRHHTGASVECQLDRTAAELGPGWSETRDGGSRELCEGRIALGGDRLGALALAVAKNAESVHRERFAPTLVPEVVADPSKELFKPPCSGAFRGFVSPARSPLTKPAQWENFLAVVLAVFTCVGVRGRTERGEAQSFFAPAWIQASTVAIWLAVSGLRCRGIGLPSAAGKVAPETFWNNTL